MPERKTDTTDEAHGPDIEHDLPGSFAAVLMMAVFFLLCWGAVFAIAMVRR